MVKKEESVIKYKRFKVDPAKGLSEEQVLLREKDKLTNKMKKTTTKSYLQIFAGNIFTFLNLLCFLVFLAFVLIKEPAQVLFMVIIIANLMIGIIQEIKAKRTIEKISLVTAPTATVIRNGEQKKIPTDNVVLDDILVYSLGDQICTDGKVISGNASINEGLLTGESSPVKKQAGDRILAGSFVVSGTCVSIVEKVGEQNYSSVLSAKAKKYKKPESDILRAIRVVIHSVSIIILPLALITFLTVYLGGGRDYIDAIRKAATSMIGMIPAGMFLLVSVALAVGIIRLAKKRTLVQDLYSIEMLARSNIICLDKTGTLTDGTMKVSDVIIISTDEAYVKEKIGLIGYNLTANNQTSKALLNYFGKTEVKADSVMEFNSTNKMSAISLNGITYIVGAPEFVLKKPIVKIQNQIDKYLQQGARVLMLAQRQGTIKDDKLPAGNSSPLAIVVIEDNIKSDVIDTIKWFYENNVEMKIISGDNAQAVSAISKRVGLPDGDKFVSLEGKSDKEVAKAALKYVVFGRVSPEQKAIIIKALKKAGNKVAMTGDGVNDILALKEADCSIAMAEGAEAARSVSSIVMLDSNFSSMPSIVAEGRRVVNNISKSSSLFLMKTFFTIFLTIICFFMPSGFVFDGPNSYILLELFVIGIPSFFLALQENKEPIKGDFLTNLTVKAFPAALTLTLNVVLCYIFLVFVPMDMAEFKTLCSLTLLLTGMMILFKLCRPFDKHRAFLCMSCVLATFVALFVVYAFPSLNILNYTRLSWTNLIFMLGIMLTTYLVYSGMHFLVSKIVTVKFTKSARKKTEKINHKKKIEKNDGSEQ